MIMICECCKLRKLQQKNLKMTVGSTPSVIGQCQLCGSNNNELYSYEEERK